MIELVESNLLEADVDALVNTVNSVGVMGRGIALQFKNAFPENFKVYVKACEAKQIEPGRMFVYDQGELYVRGISSTSPRSGTGRGSRS